jgi:hypothetical protein
MEPFLPAVVHQVLVTSNTCSLKSLRAQLLNLKADEMNSGWEEITVRLLHPCIVHTNLRVWDTTIEPRLGVWLVFAVSIAAGRATSHFNGYN